MATRKKAEPMRDKVAFWNDLPGWMRSGWGQWLARNLPYWGRRWKKEMDAALLLEREYEARKWNVLLLGALNRWAAANFADGLRRHEAIGAWCAWRSTAENLHRERERMSGHRLELPLELAGMPTAEESFHHLADAVEEVRAARNERAERSK